MRLSRKGFRKEMRRYVRELEGESLAAFRMRLVKVEVETGICGETADKQRTAMAV